MSKTTRQSAFQSAAALHRAGRLAEAEAAYLALQKVHPANAGLLQALGLVCAQQRRYGAAVEWLQRALALDPRQAQTHLNLASALNALGRPAEAVKACTRALQLQPVYPEARAARGNCLLAQGLHAEALVDYEQALAAQPKRMELWVNRGNALRALGRDAEALTCYERALALQPAALGPLYNRACTQFDLGQYGAALDGFERVLDWHPDHADAWYQRGNVLCRLRRQQEGIASYDEALRLAPGNAAAWHRLGLALLGQRRKDDALAAYGKALALQPDFVDALRSQGTALLLTRQYAAAAASYQRVLELAPDTDQVAGALLDCRRRACAWQDYAALHAQVLAGVAAGRPLCSPFVLLSASDDPALQLACASDFTRRHYPPATTPLWQGERYQHERIRVAYLSADFHNHPTAFLMAELFELHDRERFACFAYSFGPERSGPVRERLERAFERFEDVTELSDADVAQWLRADEIDIVVDLKGYTLLCRPGILARRPAPVQVSYLGYPGTLGASWMDYIIADATVIPPGDECHYSEQVVRLPFTYQVNDRQRPIAAYTPTRAELGLPEQGFVFCCFNSNYKITPNLFALWLRLLRQVDGSVLWLLGDQPETEGNLRAEAQRGGVDPARLVFAPRRELPDHLARLRRADLFLDTLPYNAHTTASDALWAGLPVLTCLGASFAARVAGSLLRAVGLPELVTDNLHDYETRALYLAQHPATLAGLKQKLATNRAQAPLFDSPRFARHLEAAFQHMHERSQQGLPPASFAVPAQQAPATDTGSSPAATQPSPATRALQQAFALHQQGRLGEAEAAYRALLEEAPRWYQPLQLLGTLCAQQQRHEEAVEWLQAALVLDQSQAAAYHNLGTALRQLARDEEAVLAFDRALVLQPGHVKALVERANCLRSLGRNEAALASYEQALAHEPERVDVLVNHGKVLRALGRHEAALASYERALALQPALMEARFNRANTCMTLQRDEAALADLRQVLAADPYHVAAWCKQGHVLCRLRRYDAAQQSFEQALRQDPRRVDAWVGLGLVLMSKQMRSDALKVLARALALQPDNIDALRSQGDALLLGKQYEQALAVYEHLLTLAPDSPFLPGMLYTSSHHACDWRQHARHQRDIVAGVRAGRQVCTPFVFVSVAADPQLQLDCARLFVNERYPVLPAPLWQGERYEHARIRVGYLSANFHSHAVAYVLAELFELHDRDAFECFAYSFGPEREGAMRQRLEAAFEHFADVSELSDSELAQRLRADEIDIAVDLMGFTLHCRPGVLALRPAPVAMAYIGYPGSLGAPWMDYILADATVLPPGEEHYYSEKVVRMPHSYQVNDRKREIAATVPPRSELGLPEQGFVFCCFNNSYKLTPEMFGIWMRLLAAVEGSVLWLVGDGPEVANNLRREARQRGVAPERLVFAARCSLPEHLARVQQADLFLDTLPYNAHATASDTLWAGVPLLTCRGTSFASRVAASLLQALELPELVTTSLEEYEARALQLARDPATLGALRQKLAGKRQKAPLFDTPRFTRHLERAYRHIHARSQQGLPPEDFNVPS